MQTIQLFLNKFLLFSLYIYMLDVGLVIALQIKKLRKGIRQNMHIYIYLISSQILSS